ncbi:MAG: hypothetical protein L3K19_05840 [Thermoplasmata archaeon]|nr:hypothetical protein [Thermoplasmata archaeon]
MIQATARVLQNIIEIRVGGETWTCRPVVSATGAITRRIASLFSTVYETYRSTEPEVVYSTVSYHVKKDEIIVQIGEQRWKTESSLFGPITFEYGGLPYSVNEKLTGKFAVIRNGQVIATGELGFRSCVIREYPAELEGFLTNLSLGFLIRTLVWEMFR